MRGWCIRGSSRCGAMRTRSCSHACMRPRRRSRGCLRIVVLRDDVTAPATRLLVGTKRGLFVVTSDAQRDVWTVSPPRLAGREVYHAFIDARDGTAWAATDHAVWGAHVHRSTDGGTTWETLGTAPHYADERGLKAIWHLAPGPAASPSTLYAGIEPAG